jgi:hypothetical protein
METSPVRRDGKYVRKTHHNNEWWHSPLYLCEVFIGNCGGEANWTPLDRRLKSRQAGPLQRLTVGLSGGREK